MGPTYNDHSDRTSQKPLKNCRTRNTKPLRLQRDYYSKDTTPLDSYNGNRNNNSEMTNQRNQYNEPHDGTPPNTYNEFRNKENRDGLKRECEPLDNVSNENSVNSRQIDGQDSLDDKSWGQSPSQPPLTSEEPPRNSQNRCIPCNPPRNGESNKNRKPTVRRLDERSKSPCPKDPQKAARNNSLESYLSLIGDKCMQDALNSLNIIDKGPKKKGKTSGKSGKSSGGIIDGLSTAEMSRDQLEQFALRIRTELEREREERNFFQVERDKLRTFWEITRQQLEESRASLRNQDRALEEAAEKHEQEIKQFKQKVKHLMFEHQSHLSDLQVDGLVGLKLAEDEFEKREIELLQDKKALKEDVRKIQMAHSEEIRNIKLEHAEELSQSRKEFEQKVSDIEKRYKQMIQDIQLHEELKSDLEVSEVEERKNVLIEKLKENHAEALNNLKVYYTEITINNLSIIANLKTKLEEAKKRALNFELELGKYKIENKKLLKPLQDAEQKVADLERQREMQQKEKQSFMNVKKHLTKARQDLAQMKCVHNALEVAFEKVQQERDDLRERFVDSILEVQQRSNLRSVVLESKVTQLRSDLELRDVQLGELVAMTDTEVASVQPINVKLEELLATKNQQIKDLKLQLTRLVKLYEDCVNSVRLKLRQLGIPESEIAFEPVSVKITTKTLPLF
ncbi:hypothetical protein M8J76_011406 [Diaphorina citri]|nr:hypothetical protein M8J76_011406 [Diaphorina citri]